MPRLWLQTNRLRSDLQEDDAGSADRRTVQELARPIQNARGEAVPVSSDLGHHRRLERVCCRERSGHRTGRAGPFNGTSVCVCGQRWLKSSVRSVRPMLPSTCGAFPAHRFADRLAQPCRRRHAPAPFPLSREGTGAKARPSYSTETRTTPASIMPRARAAFKDRSMIRPRTNGPLSAIRHWIDRPE